MVWHCFFLPFASDRHPWDLGNVLENKNESRMNWANLEEGQTDLLVLGLLLCMNCSGQSFDSFML